MALEITLTQADDIWANQANQHSAMTTRQKYYEGYHDIVGRGETYADGAPKSERVANWVRYIVDRYVGALTSIPYQVSKADDAASTEGIDLYAQIAKDNDLSAQDTENLRRALLHGFAVEAHSFVDSEIVITGYDAREWGLVWDSDGTLRAGIRRTNLPAGSILNDQYLPEALTFMSIYTEDRIRDYMQSAGQAYWTQVNEVVHKYGRTPLVVWGVNDSQTSIITDAIIGQVDEYNDVDSASGDDIRYSSNAILVVRGHDPDWVKKNESAITKSRMLPLADDGSAEYLTKGNDVQRVESRLKRTRELIHMMGEVPDVEQIVGATGNTSGIALKLKFLPMIQRTAGMTNYLKKAMRDRIDLINIVHGKTNRPQVEDYEITIQFSLPVNREEEWKSIGSLAGIVSHRKMLELLTDVDDPEQELEQVRKETEEGLGVAMPGAQPAQPEKSPEQQAIEQQAMVDQAARNMQPVLEQAISAVADAALDVAIRAVNARIPQAS